MGTTRGWGLDARFVLRSLWGSRGYVATAVVVLACAVAANASVFSYVRGTLLPDVPYSNPDEVLLVWGSNVTEGQLRDVVSGPNFLDLRERSTTLSSVAALHSDAAYLMVDGRPVVLDAQEVSVEFFDVLGVDAHRGRLFEEEDRMSGNGAPVVITHAFWHDHLGGREDVVGLPLDFETDPRTIIGVLPPDFEFIAPAPLFLPAHDDQLAAYARSNIHWNIVARLAPSASLEAANRELAEIMTEISREWAMYEGWTFFAEPLHDITVAAVRPVILALTGTVLLVLLVALVNLATLFRVRAFARGPELGVRSALGAGTASLTRVLLMETVGIAVVGATLGLVATPFILDRVAALVPAWVAIPDSAARVPILSAQLDPAVALTSIGIAVIGSILLSWPTLRSALSGTSLGVRRGGHEGIRGTRLLVGVEVAAATALCIGAGLMLRSTHQLLTTDVGIEAEGLLTMMVGDVWGLDAEGRTAYFEEVVARVEQLPGVESAGMMGYVDFQAEDDYARVYFLDRELQPVRDIREEWRRVDAGLFASVGMRIASGRTFDPDDFQGTPRSAIVNQAFATKHYPDGDAVGQLVSTHNARYRDLRIIGVSVDVRTRGPASVAPPMLYVPLQGDPRGTQGLHVRVQGEPMAFAESVRDAVWSVDPSQPIHWVSPMTQWVSMWVAVPRTARALVSSLAGLAGVLATIGIFGVVAYTVRTRRKEFGVRLALGASPRRLERDQLHAIGPIIVLGLAAGTVIGIAGASAARALLHQVEPTDPLTLGVALTVMGAASLCASLLPARRAGRIDPVEVIHR